MKKFITPLLICFGFLARAEEGMLIPSLLSAFESDMQAKGMKLTAADIYSVNQSSLKDAIMHFGGGCTAELVSNKGLLLTNHHCGLSQVQQHSSEKNDYLKNGFWAKTYAEELANPGLTATRIVRIDDVTTAMLFGTEGLEDGNKINEIMKRNMKTLIEDATRNTHYRADIQAFDYGNSFYLMVKEVFTDVRLVGAPPSSIGKFGGDTDNWVWPRHTGDFSVFRIYAGADNKPADYNGNNKPYEPINFLKVAFNDRKAGDFTMVYGFPGFTEQHLSSGNLKFIVEKQRPMEISMRTKSLSVIDAAMKTSDKTRIQYMAKQARIANAWKKNIGQIDGLKQLGAVDLKMIFEAEYEKRANSKDEWGQYAGLVKTMNQLVADKSNFEFHDVLFYEYLYVGPEYFRLCRALEDIERNYQKYKESGELQKKIENLKKGADGFFKDYDIRVDQQIFDILTKEFTGYLSSNFAIDGLSNPKLSKTIYAKSVLVSKEKYLAFLDKFSEKSFAKLAKDPGYAHFKKCWSTWKDKIEPAATEYSYNMTALLKEFVKGKQIMFPDLKQWSDANSTLRVTYGKLEGSAPVDGMAYTEHTTLKGMIDKFNTGNPDFELEARMVDLYKTKNYGKYAQKGELWVCFTGSNHTTGGNSGSPVLDANGNLMGLNFDRSWESTMSDYYFDPKRCRNIVVDIRYVMWVMDIYCGASHLVDEMVLVK
jgi:V8-like Glu-specific endopeptidase